MERSAASRIRVAFGNLGGNPLEGCDQLVEQPRRSLASPFELAQRRVQPTGERAFGIESATGIGHRIGELLGIHHQSAMQAELFLLADHRRDGFELGQSMVDEGALRLAALDHAAMLLDCRFGDRQRLEALRHPVERGSEVAVGVEQLAVRLHRTGRAVMLPASGQHRPDLLTQQRDADRLIVDESAPGRRGPGPAAARSRDQPRCPGPRGERRPHAQAAG